MSRGRRRRFLEKLGSMYLWHRYVGLATAILLVHLAVTGILLNHTHDANLDSTYVENRILLSIYNIKPPVNILGFDVGGKWVTKQGAFLYLDQETLAQVESELVAAIRMPDTLLVVLEQELLLFSEAGELIERIANPSRDSVAIRSAGTNAEGGLLISAGERMYRSDAELLTWSEIERENIVSPSKSSLPENLRLELSDKFMTTTLTWERVMQDLHSGRIASFGGRVVIDLVGLLLILLALSGIVVWLQRIAAQRERDRVE